MPNLAAGGRPNVSAFLEPENVDHVRVREGHCTPRAEVGGEGGLAHTRSLRLYRPAFSASPPPFFCRDYRVTLKRTTLPHGTQEGLPQLPARSGPDWGEVGGLAAIAFARHRFGGAFMDAARGLCIGIDGVTLDACAVDTGTRTVRAAMRSLMGEDSLAMPWTAGFEVELRVQGLGGDGAAKPWRLVVSGRDCGSYTGARLAAGVRVAVGGV